MLDKQEWQNNNCSKSKYKRDKKEHRIENKRKNHQVEPRDQEVLEDKEEKMIIMMIVIEREEAQGKEGIKKTEKDKAEETDDVINCFIIDSIKLFWI